VALGVAFADLEALEADENVNVNAIHTTRLYHLGMNNAVAPFDNELVRQAVSMAIPYDAIIDNVILGYGQQPRSPVSVGMEGYTDAHWNYGDGDMDAARALLEEAGYPDGFEVDLTIPQEDQSRVDAATWIQSGLAEIGITVNINAVPAGEYAGLLNALDDNGQHPLPFFIQEWYSWGNDPFYQLTFNLKCGAFTNYVNYCNPEVDGIIEAGTFSRDPEERAALLDRVQQVIVEEAPWAYLYQPDWIVATGADVTGIALFDDLTLRYGYLGRSE
jgi:peptide/nickel transport system substrate-binding protein